MKVRWWDWTEFRGVEQSPTLYDIIVAPLDRRALRPWRRQLFASLRGDVLELGVGTGLNLAAYGRRARMIGIDPERSLLERACGRSAGRVVRLVTADAQSLPFADRAFDWVTSALVFCSIPDPSAALAEVARVLKPTGRLVQLEHTRSGQRLLDSGLELVAPMWKALAGGCHLTRDTPALLHSAGWQLLRHERHLNGLIRLLESAPPAS